MATMGILSALMDRERTGVGQKVETSLLNSLIWLQYLSFQGYLFRGVEPRKQQRSNAVNPMGNNYECKDGKWITLAEPQSDRFWRDFCKVIKMSELASDARYENAKSRAKNRRTLIKILDKVFISKDRDTWLQEFGAAKVKFAYGPVNSLSEAVKDPQVAANEYLVDYEHPALGTIKQVIFPVKFSKSETSIKCPAPIAGEHTEEILLKAGYTLEDVAGFRDRGII